MDEAGWVEVEELLAGCAGVKRLPKPHGYPAGLGRDLVELKTELIKQLRTNNE